MANLENAETNQTLSDSQLEQLEQINEKLSQILSSVSSDDTNLLQELHTISDSLETLQTALDDQAAKDAELSFLISEYIQYQYDRDEYSDSLADPDVDYQTYMKGSQSVLVSLNLILLVVFLFFLGSYYARVLFRKM